MMGVNCLPARYGWKCSLTQSIAMDSRSMAPREESPAESLRLAKGITSSTPYKTCTRATPAPVSLVSVCKGNGWSNAGNAGLVGDAIRALSYLKGDRCFGSHGMRILRALTDLKARFFTISLRGVAIVLYPSTNLCKRHVIPTHGLNYAIMHGGVSCAMAAILLSAGRGSRWLITMPTGF